MFGMIRAIIRLCSFILFNALVLYLIHSYSPWWFEIISTQYNVYITFLFLAVLFFVTNTILKQILKLVTFPLKYLTLGLSTLFLNIFVIYLFEYIVNKWEFGIEVHLGTIQQVFLMSLSVSIVFFLYRKLK